VSRGIARIMADIAPAHNAAIVCHACCISGSAAIAVSSLCHSVIQSCASVLASGKSAAEGSSVSCHCPVWSAPEVAAIPHSSSL
jgi:hypothetical protein